MMDVSRRCTYGDKPRPEYPSRSMIILYSWHLIIRQIRMLHPISCISTRSLHWRTEKSERVINGVEKLTSRVQMLHPHIEIRGKCLHLLLVPDMKQLTLPCLTLPYLDLVDIDAGLTLRLRDKRGDICPSFYIFNCRADSPVTFCCVTYLCLWLVPASVASVLSIASFDLHAHRLTRVITSYHITSHRIASHHITCTIGAHSYLSNSCTIDI